MRAMSRERARELVGEENEKYFFEKAYDYAQAVRRFLEGESKEECIQKRRLEKILVPKGMHTCTCGSRRISTVTLQMRRADESATVFLICSECSRVWRT